MKGTRHMRKVAFKIKEEKNNTETQKHDTQGFTSKTLFCKTATDHLWTGNVKCNVLKGGTTKEKFHWLKIVDPLLFI